MKLVDKISNYVDLLAEIRADIAKEHSVPGGAFVNDVKERLDLSPDKLVLALYSGSAGLIEDIEVLATVQYYKAIFVDMGREETWKPVADKSPVTAVKMLRTAMDGFTIKEAKIIVDLYRNGKL